MGLFDIRPYKSITGGSLEVRRAPMNASEVFLPGEIIMINSDGEAQGVPIDGTQIILGETGIGTGVQFGIAVNGPGATASAARPSSRAFINPETGTTYATGDWIYYHPANRGNLFISQALVAGGASGVSTAVTGAARGIVYELVYDASGTPDAGFGVELTAGSVGTDLLAKVDDVLDSNYRPISATATNGVWVVYEILNSIA